MSKNIRPTYNLIGQTLKDSYLIKAQIGQGGMGVVYLAKQLSLERSVAVKVLPHQDSARDILDRFFQEAQILSKINHPNIVSILDFGAITEGYSFIVMEYLMGQTLDYEVPETGLGLKQIIEVMQQICAAVGTAHKFNLVHRDLKPSNIFLVNKVAGTYVVKVLDFGLAKALSRDQGNVELTPSDTIIGTPAYMSPEQIQDVDKVDVRSDIYSLGALLYFMFVGQAPFRGKTSEILTKHLTETPDVTTPPRFQTAEGQVVAPVILKAMSKKRSQRYQTTEEFLNDLISQATKNLPNLSTDLNIKGRATGAFNIPSEIEINNAYANQSLVDEAEKLSNSNQERPSMAERNRSNDSVSIVLKKKNIYGIVALVVILGIIGTGIFFKFSSSTGSKEPANPTTTPTTTAIVRGVTNKEIIIGMSAPFSGTSKDRGSALKVGIEAYFSQVNEAGGINGRKLTLTALDDAYEPDKALANTKELIEQRNAFGIICSVGSSAAKKAVPYILDKKVLYFAPSSGSNLIRKDPPDRYVFNFRAGFAEETAALVNYLIQVKKIKPKEIAVFGQNDDYGDSGFAGVAKALRKYDRNEKDILYVKYERNTLDVEAAVAKILENKRSLRAVVMLAAYKPGAKFIKQLKDAKANLIFTNVSSIGGDAFVEELNQLGPKYASGIIVSQIVPYYKSQSTTVIKYQDSMKKYFPNESLGFISLEGYLAANVLCEGLKAAGQDLNTEKLITSLESIKGLDLGIGAIINFGPSEHQASHKIWGTIIDDNGEYQSLDLE